MTKILSIVFALLVVPLMAQQPGSLSPVLIGSSGNYSTGGNFTLSSSVGECIVPTSQAGPFFLTQGFQQPAPNNTLSMNSTLVYYNSTCLGANDGVATVTVTGGSAPYTYVWSTGSGDTLATNDSLAPGTYSVTVTDNGNLSQSHTFVILDGTEICDINVYSGFTPNGDGNNDFWIVDYLELHQPNEVEIYNRWGYMVWHGVNYDNVNVVWDGKKQDGSELPDGTYYWVIKEGTALKKGWVEMTH